MAVDDVALRKSTLSETKRALLEKLARKSVESLPEKSRPRADDAKQIPRRPPGLSAPLSFAQQRLWFLEQLNPGNIAYNMLTALRMSGSLSVLALNQTLVEIGRRHEMLRTTFGLERGRPAQFVSAVNPVCLRYTDLTGLGNAAINRLADTLTNAETVSPFDLTAGPLFRALLIRIGDDENVLVVTMHHIISDGWSMGVLVNEVSSLYDAFARGTASDFVELPIQYPDFAAWQRKWLQGRVLEEQLSYWRKRLSGAPEVIELPADRPRPAVQSYRGAAIPFEIPASEAHALAELSSSAGATLFMSLLAAFQLLLFRYSGSSDVVVGSPIANRHRMEIEGLIGFFVNTLAYRAVLSGDQTFRLLLDEVKDTTLEAYGHQDLPFERVVEELHPERSLSYNPLFQVAFALQNAPVEELHLRALVLTPQSVDLSSTRFDLEFHLWDHPGRLGGFVAYAVDLFDGPTVSRMIAHFRNVIAGVTANSSLTVEQVELLDEAERCQILREWNDTESAYSNRMLVHQLVEDWSARTPDSLSLSDGESHLTYARLNSGANQIATFLGAFGVVPDSIVGVLMSRSVEWVITLMGILKAGAAYACFDPSYPKDRIGYMVEDCRAKVVVAGREHIHLIEPGKTPVAGIESVLNRIVACDDGKDETVAGPAADPENASYAVFTSGSTGKPKGIVTSHASLLNLVTWYRETYSIAQCDRALQIARCGFDAASWEVWSYLASGAVLLLVDEETRISPPELGRWLIRNDITVGWLPPALVEPIFQEGGVDGLKMRLMFSGSDRVQLRPPAGSSFMYVNAYGPSEAAVMVTTGAIPSLENATPPHIGRPVANSSIYILDGVQRQVPVGVAGELSIAGSHLARGYLFRPDLTAEKFAPNPFQGFGARIYGSGDLARYRPDGNIEFLGRIDNQIKIRGFRIELGEIEAALLESPLVHEAVALASVEGAEKSIAAYVAPVSVGSGSSPLDSLERSHVSEWRTLYDQTYSQSTDNDSEFNIVGWNSSYTGAPIAEDEMREWRDATVAEIIRHYPKRALEIGCGTGLLLSRIAPETDEYWGTDFSAVSLDYVRGRLERLGANADKVRLLQKQADDFSQIPENYFDAVILNSVIQYFPGFDYLFRVLSGAASAVKPGGFVFAGDIRNLELLDVFQTSILLEKPLSELTIDDMRATIQSMTAQEEELLVSPKFFPALRLHIPQIGGVELHLKRGRHHNELTKYRYNAVLYIGAEHRTSGIEARFDWQRDSMNLDRLRELLSGGGHESLLVRDVPNCRIIGEIEAAASVRSGYAQPVSDLIERSRAAASEALDPETICRAGEALSYQACLYASGSFDNAFFDVLFTRTEADAGVRTRPMLFSNPVAAGADLAHRENALRSYVNHPLQDKVGASLVPELRRFLSERLPEYMIPSDLVVIDSLPRNANGKVDRKRLPRPSSRIRGQMSPGYAPPATPEEELIAGVWCQLLGVEHVGATDNFFDIGGHSLRATQAVSGIRDIFKVEIPLLQFFADPTVAGIARKVEVARRAGGGMSLPRVEPAVRGGLAPLSLAQQRLWFIDQLNPGTPVYNMPLGFRAKGQISYHVLAQAISEVVRRHETLRTVFVEREGPQQYVRLHSRICPSIADLSDVPDDAVLAAEARAIATQERDRPFNLGRGPVARFSILRFDSWEYALLITMHHIISDGWSFTIFMDEVLRLYEAFDGGLPSPLEEMEIQYADFCCWQREWIDKEIIDRQIAFWKERLGDAPPVVELPPDKPRPPVQSFFGASLPIAIPRNVISSVKEFARTNHATVFMVMLAAFQALLYRYTAEEMIITGTPIAGRNRAELERLIGFFVNTLIMKADVAGRHTFRELVDQVREFALGAYSNQEVPFEKLVEELHPKRDMSRNPLFQIMFALQSTPPGIENRLGFQLSAEESDASTARFDLELQLFENERAFAGHLTYSTDLYDEQAIRRLLSHYVTLLDRAAKEPGRRIEDLPLMTETDEAQAAGFWSGRRSPVPDLLIHQLFEAQARRTPDTVAAVGNGHFCSYRTLERSAERLARSLGRRGLEIESRAGVYVSRGIDMLVAVLGILKCGAAYVPLDPTYPAERMSCIIRDSRLGVLVTERQFQDQVSHHGVQGVLIEEVTGTVSRQARCGVADRDLARDEANVTTNEWYDEECVLGLSSANLAYVIYTSGSTGTPKGVAIEHGSAAALLQWAGGLFSKAELAWVLAATSICFDLSVFEIFAPLACGGTVVLAENALQIRELAARHSATLINTVPSAMVEIVSDGAIPDSVVTVNLAGEPVPGHLVREIFQKSGASRVYNLYGPTEDTTYSTFALLDSQCAERPGIGGPISNTQVYVLQPGCRPVPPGIRGVIHLSGSGLARCYLDKPDTTAETFLPAPFRGLNGVRMYSTGDLGCFLQDGKLDFLGRADHQVKIRGFRIELGEIEMVLRQHRAVRETTAIVVSSPNPNLVAYAVCEEGKSVTPAELKSFLAEKLPGYMTPSTAVILPRMPLTPNGKVDRRALADAADWWRDPFAYVAPTTRTEELIARIWEEMLGVKPIGLNHNFFDLGGHSLLAIRVLSRIREATGLSIPLAAIFQSPTVGQLAQILDGKAPLTDVSGLVEIQKGDERPALYLVPGIGGGLADFANLAPAIGPDQPVRVFTAFGTNKIGPSVEETAEAYVGQLLELQQSGPYLIGGWSFGAVVAFEMAKRLRSRNKGVALLVLFDMVAPLPEGLRAMVAISTQGQDGDSSQALFAGETSEPRVMASLVTEITRGAASVYLEEIETLPRQDMLSLVVDRIKSSNTIPADIPSDVLTDWLCGYADRFRAMTRYNPTIYPGRIVLFTARKLPADNPAYRARHALLGATLGWDRLVDQASGGQVEVHPVNGSHYTMLDPPHVWALGTTVAEVIETALRLPGSSRVAENTLHMG